MFKEDGAIGGPFARDGVVGLVTFLLSYFSAVLVLPTFCFCVEGMGGDVLGVGEESQVADERSGWTEAADWVERLLCD